MTGCGLQPRAQALVAGVRCRLGYERALLRLLSRLVADMDRKIEKAQERARLESMPKPLKPEQQAEVDALRAQAKGGCGGAGAAVCGPPARLTLHDGRGGGGGAFDLGKELCSGAALILCGRHTTPLPQPCMPGCPSALRVQT
jgi:hypothetical protein